MRTAKIIATECVELFRASQKKAVEELGYFSPMMHLPKKAFELKKEFEEVTGEDWNSSHEKYL